MWRLANAERCFWNKPGTKQREFGVANDSPDLAKRLTQWRDGFVILTLRGGP
jgi:hypothetical protein